MTNDHLSHAGVGDAAVFPALDAAVVTAGRHHIAPVTPTGMAAAGDHAGLRAVGLQGNSTTLVELSCTANSRAAEIPAEFLVVSRDQRAQVSLKPQDGEKLIVPLAAGDYLVVARFAAPAGARSDMTISRRVLVCAGRAYAYDLPTPLAAIPPEHPDPQVAGPFLQRLAYTGSVDGAARLVVEWSSGIGAHCLCIRSPRWGDHWLPYALPSAAAAFCLHDGAYQMRAARQGENGACAGGWSEITDFVVADGRLAAAPANSAGALIDWLGVKPGWRPNGAADVQFGGTDNGKIAVKLACDTIGTDAGLRYLIGYRRENGPDWETASSARPEQTLWLEPGQYRIRICAVDETVFLRSEFFGESLLWLPASDPPVQARDVAPSPADMSVAWTPLPAAGASREAGADDGLAEFDANPVSPLADGPHSIGVDLIALAYGQAPQAGGQDRDIAVTRAVAQGGLEPDQMAAAGDYFLRTGQLEDAWRIFQELGRRFRGVDFAQLRCAHMAAICGRRNEARELLTLAFASAKVDAGSTSSGPTVTKATRDRTRVQQQALRAATAKVDLLATRTGTLREALENKARQYLGVVREIPVLRQKAGQFDALRPELFSLRFKAEQYDRLMRDLPALRYKAKRYDEMKKQASASWLQRGADLIRRWSVRLPSLRHH